MSPHLCPVLLLTCSYTELLGWTKLICLSRFPSSITCTFNRWILVWRPSAVGNLGLNFLISSSCLCLECFLAITLRSTCLPVQVMMSQVGPGEPTQCLCYALLFCCLHTSELEPGVGRLLHSVPKVPESLHCSLVARSVFSTHISIISIPCKWSIPWSIVKSGGTTYIMFTRDEDRSLWPSSAPWRWQLGVVFNEGD